MLFCAKDLMFCGRRRRITNNCYFMRRIAIQLDFAGGYGRGVLRGVMQYANLRTDWEFVMPPMYSQASKRLDDPRVADGVIAMLHAARSVGPFRRAGVPRGNTPRTAPRA